MPSVNSSLRTEEYDAAQALLDLRYSFSGPKQTEESENSEHSDLRKKMKEGVQLFLNCLIEANAANSATDCITDSRENGNVIVEQEMIITPTNDLDNHSESSVIKTCADAATQTDENTEPNVALTDIKMKSLYNKIHILEAQLKDANSNQITPSTSRSFDESPWESHEASPGTSREALDEMDWDETDMINKIKEENDLSDKESTSNKSTFKYNKASKGKENVNVNKMVSLGDGHAVVPLKLLKNINWKSHTNATRKLLGSVFSRRVLATHSLTGKPSPAFPNKPPKKKLDAALVSDIVQTVVERCRVPENIVRTSITTKCADESKMLRVRQKNVKQGKRNIKMERSPSESSE